MADMQQSTRRGLRLVSAELVVLVGVVVSAALGLSVLVGPNGLGLVDLDPRWPVVGQSQYVMAVETTFGPDAGIVVRGAPLWTDTPDGTRDAVTGGPPVEVTGPYTGQVGFFGPTLAQRWSWVAWRAAGPLLAAGSLLLVLRVVRSVRTGSPFTDVNAGRLRTLALLVGVGGTALSVAGEWLRRHLLDTSAAADIVQRDWEITFVPLLAGVVIGVVAEVWRAGVKMAEDLDGVV